jgi:hypothetical protein
MSEEIIDELSDLTKKITAKWAAAYLPDRTRSWSPSDVWMAWADSAGDMVQAGYLWVQLVDKWCRPSPPTGPGSGPPAHPGAQTFLVAAHGGGGVPVVGVGLHPTALLDGYGNVIPEGRVSATVGGPVGAVQMISVTVTVQTGDVSGRYAGSVVTDEADLVVDSAEFTIT